MPLPNNLIPGSVLPFEEDLMLIASFGLGWVVIPAAFSFFTRRVAKFAFRINLFLAPVLFACYLVFTSAGLGTAISMSLVSAACTPILRWKYLKLDRRPPWEDIGHLTRVAPPPEPRPAKRDWYAPEVSPEMRMVPQDYKKYISTYGRGAFWGKIVIEDPSWMLDKKVSTPDHLVEFLRSLNGLAGSLSVNLTCYGTDDRDEAYGTSNDVYLGVGWAESGQRILLRNKGIDVDTWPVLVVGESGVDYGAKGLTHYLSGLLRGRVQSSAFDQDWIDKMRQAYGGKSKLVFKPL